MYAYFTLHKFKKWPSEFMSLPREEKAFVIACIDEYIKKQPKPKK